MKHMDSALCIQGNELNKPVADDRHSHSANRMKCSVIIQEKDIETILIEFS